MPVIYFLYWTRFIRTSSIDVRDKAHTHIPARDLHLCPERRVVAEDVPAATYAHALAHIAGGEVAQHSQAQLVW